MSCYLPILKIKIVKKDLCPQDLEVDFNGVRHVTHFLKTNEKKEKLAGCKFLLNRLGLAVIEKRKKVLVSEK